MVGSHIVQPINPSTLGRMNKKGNKLSTGNLLYRNMEIFGEKCFSIFIQIAKCANKICQFHVQIHTFPAHKLCKYSHMHEKIEIVFPEIFGKNGSLFLCNILTL